ncbi:LysR family transcriptional regulator [Roseixanthobacter glucoisosaccharinicivorans]|uniref:LysR family transcriptional regulator n=1 Tax=Roseixanthobacter glucoisosaccharinicivorans TaxID=3119923 RepID=UPI0037266C19
MSLSSADWENQRAFLAVLEHGSLSAAARELAVAQATVRRRLEALERGLGQALFTRSPSGLTPTEAARALGPHARAMAAAAAAFARTASADAGAVAGSVRITASEMVGAHVLPAILAELLQRHPRLRFETHLSNRTQDLLHQEADIAVRMVRPVQSALVVKHVGAVKLGLFAAPAYLERAGVPRDVADLARFAIVGPDRDVDFLRALAALSDGVVPGALAYRTDSHFAQLEAIRAGAGIGVCQIALAARTPVLTRVLPDLFTLQLETFVAMHEDLRQVRRVRATFDHLVARLQTYCALT